MNAEPNVRELQAAKPVSETFIIICGRKEEWIDGDLNDRHSVISEVSNGAYDGLRRIIAFSLETGRCRDATDEICSVVINRWAEDDKELSDKQYEFVELTKGVNFARAFRREVA